MKIFSFLLITNLPPDYVCRSGEMVFQPMSSKLCVSVGSSHYYTSIDDCYDGSESMFDTRRIVIISVCHTMNVILTVPCLIIIILTAQAQIILWWKSINLFVVTRLDRCKVKIRYAKCENRKHSKKKVTRISFGISKIQIFIH